MSTPYWLHRLVDGTRREILELLLRSDRTVPEIAGEIGISTNAIRGHIAGLERDGLVLRRGSQRETGGKPAVIYGLSTDADELLPKAYPLVLAGLLGVLDERLGPGAVREVLSEVGAQAAPPASGSPADRVEAAAEVLRSLGGEVEISRYNGTWRIQGFSCPLSSLVRRDARVCGLAEALVARTTGGSVREQCDRGCRTRCGFEIGFPPGTA